MTLAITIAITFFLMEGVAWGMHKYIMHGVFWNLHEDHHNKKLKPHSFFERNDSFFILFSVLAITSFSIWTFNGSPVFLGIGIGISVYGIVYFIVHDLFIHQRVKIWRNTKNRYLLALRRGHKMHHKHLGKHEGECFGMLWVPIKYFKQEFKS